jgi:hypothetical protein
MGQRGYNVLRVTDEHGVKARRGCVCVDMGELRICGASDCVLKYYEG